MRSDQTQQQRKIDDETYMKIWLADQEFVKTRWTITTFFMSVSFAILAYSFQTNLTVSTALSIRIFGLIVYWFSVIIYRHFYEHTKFLRGYLTNMEKLGCTTLELQSKRDEERRNKNQRYTNEWLIGFGIFYSLGVLLLLLLHI